MQYIEIHVIDYGANKWKICLLVLYSRNNMTTTLKWKEGVVQIIPLFDDWDDDYRDLLLFMGDTAVSEYSDLTFEISISQVTVLDYSDLSDVDISDEEFIGDNLLGDNDLAVQTLEFRDLQQFYKDINESKVGNIAAIDEEDAEDSQYCELCICCKDLKFDSGRLFEYYTEEVVMEAEVLEFDDLECLFS